METRARYILIGLFVLSVIAGTFGFVYWMHGTGGLGERAVYRIRFQESVSGLLPGSVVLFNGIRVGEVTGLDLDPQDPRRVTVAIAVEPATPIRADTRVGIESRGLTGAPSIALSGGSPSAPPVAPAQGGPPLLTAPPGAGQDLTQAARDAVGRFDTILSDNSAALKGTIDNLNTFSGALARNSGRIDGILAGLEKLTGGGAKETPVTYSLTAPRNFPDLGKQPERQLAIAEPTALLALDTPRILLRTAGADAPLTEKAQWSDNLPKLLQETIIQSFENANLLGAVSRRADAFTAGLTLAIDIRNFQIAAGPQPSAEVEFSAKILGENGKIVDAKIFRASAPSPSLDPQAAVAALDAAFGRTATELVMWAARAL